MEKQGGSIILNEERKALFWTNALRQRKYPFYLFEETLKIKFMNYNIGSMSIETYYERFIDSDYENINQYIEDTLIN